MKRKMMLLLLVATLLTASIGIGYAISTPEQGPDKGAASTEPSATETESTIENKNTEPTATCPYHTHTCSIYDPDKSAVYRDIHYFFNEYDASAEIDVELNPWTYPEEKICYYGDLKPKLHWTSYSRRGLVDQENNLVGHLENAPTKGVRIRADGTAYAMYDTDTGFRYYIFLDPKPNLIVGQPMVINRNKALPTRKDFQDIKIGDSIKKVSQIDGVTAPYERQIIGKYKSTADEWNKMSERGGPLATYHYCKDGILRIEYADDPAQEGLNFIVAGFTFYEDFMVEDFDGTKVNQKILDIDLPVK